MFCPSVKYFRFILDESTSIRGMYLGSSTLQWSINGFDGFHKTDAHENCRHAPGFLELSCATKCSEDHVAFVALRSEAVSNVAKELGKTNSPG